MSAPQAPLVIVSNRLPFEVQRADGVPVFSRAPGGLVTALEAVVAARGGMWIGWPGFESEPDAEPLELPSTDRITYRAVPLTGREMSLYYAGFANRTIWPLFHYFVARTRIDGAWWRTYERVNERFAAAAADTPAEALVWVHDYQLMRVPALLRSLQPERRIAFFLHVPFPAFDVLRVLPWSRQVMAGLLGADLVAFHVREYADHFLDCAERLLGCEIDRPAGRIHHEGRTISVEAHPISIDAAQQERMARAVKVERDGSRQILAVDRLDYTKGICERVLAVERLFDRYPAYRGTVTFTQVLVPSRERVDEYQALKRDIDETVGRVNGRLSEPGWSPVRYLVRSVSPEALAALYRRADVGLVTPLRDGMNLVAKEYVASQIEDDGVLVLSEMAGAAAELPEALIVNPYDIDAVTGALARALELPPDERRTRMAALRHRVRAGSVALWADRLLQAADAAAARRASGATALDAARNRLGGWLGGRPLIALFLDYDGTLTPMADRPEEARLSDEARRVLEQAVRAPDLATVIVTGRRVEDVRGLVGIDGLTYIGSHGYPIEGPGVSYWHKAADAFQPALDEAARDLEALAVPGAVVERKPAAVAYHVLPTAPELRPRALRAAETVLRRRRLAAVQGKSGIEGWPPLGWDKGQAVLYLLRTRHGADWLERVRALYVGDDITDEFAFRSLRGIGKSILVAPPGAAGRTSADLTLPAPSDVLHLLRWLTSGALRAVP